MTTTKQKVNAFLSTKDGKRIIAYIGVGILIAMLWKVILLIGIVVGLGYCFIKNREKKNAKST